MSNKMFAKNALILMFLVSCANIFGMENRLLCSNNMSHQGSLSLLPDEILKPIFCGRNCLEDDVKAALSLRTTCKFFNQHQLLSAKQIGESCKHYSKTEKNAVMEKLLWSMYDFNYWKKRCAASILIYAGADNDAYQSYSLLRFAIQRQDKEMIAIVFENKVNPNQKRQHDDPDWFRIEDVATVAIFTNHKLFDVHQEGTKDKPNVLWKDKPNVLWHVILYQRSSELIKYYLERGVSVTKKDVANNSLLHYLISTSEYYYGEKGIAEYVAIGKLLLNAAPELLDVINDDGETVFYLAQKQLKRACWVNKQAITALQNVLEEYRNKKQSK